MEVGRQARGRAGPEEPVWRRGHTATLKKRARHDGWRRGRREGV